LAPSLNAQGKIEMKDCCLDPKTFKAPTTGAFTGGADAAPS
jgi:hypothetical protein